jgi:hypothetical protein
MLLADSAQEVGGKLYILGGGWSVIGPVLGPHSIAFKIDVPWSQANDKHHFRLSLLSADGEPILVPGPEGDQPLRIEGEFETGRPAGLPAGTDLDFAFVVNIGALPLTPGERFEWRLWIDDLTEEEWCRVFLVRPAPAL